MPDPILAADDVSLERNGHQVLSNISLSISTGAQVLIQGPSGAGKTSLFHVLGLLEPPSSGTLLVDGTSVTDLTERERARVRRETIGIVFQDFQLVPDLTAWENAALPQDHLGDRDPEWLATLFDQLGLTQLADQHPATLSGGEKQRVAIARALANRPAVVLADEPTGQLDPETAGHVMDLLLSLHEDTDTALVVISHDESIASHVMTTLRLESGQLVTPNGEKPDPLNG